MRDISPLMVAVSTKTFSVAALSKRTSAGTYLSFSIKIISPTLSYSEGLSK